GPLLVAGRPREGLAAKPGDPAPALPEPLTRETIRELVSGLSDESVRALLLKELDQRAPARPAANAAPTGLAESANRVHEALGVLLRAVPTFPATLGATLSHSSAGGHPHQLLLAFLLFLL